MWIETRQTDGDANETSRASNYPNFGRDIVIYRNQNAMDWNFKKKNQIINPAGKKEKGVETEYSYWHSARSAYAPNSCPNSREILIRF